jgi:hypothetical protein
MGDYGGSAGDGHMLERKLLIKSTHSVEAVTQAFQKAEVEYDLFLSRECCEYEDAELSADFIAKYIQLFNVTDSCKLEELRESISCECYVYLYLSIASLELTELKCCTVDDLPERYIGGYGLL